METQLQSPSTQDLELDNLAAGLVGRGFDRWLEVTKRISELPEGRQSEIYAKARSLAEQDLKTAIHSGEPVRVMNALFGITYIAYSQRDYFIVGRLIREEGYWQERFAKKNILSVHFYVRAASLLRDQGDLAEARKYSDQGLSWQERSNRISVSRMRFTRWA